MGKKKIGEIAGKPIIIGDKNLQKANEIMFTSGGGYKIVF